MLGWIVVNKYQKKLFEKILGMGEDAIWLQL